MGEEKKQKSIMDTENYAELSKPFESVEAAEKALNDFWNEFYELRNKYKIPDVYSIVRFETPNGQMMTKLHAGNGLYAESMTAWAFGHEQATRQESIAKILDDACKAYSHKHRK